MSLLVWAIALLVTAVAATLQGTVGVGFAMMAVPLLALLHPDLAPVPQLLIALPLSLTMAARERTSMDVSGIGWIVLGRFPGVAVGLALVSIATRTTLDIFIGASVLLAVAAIGTGFHVTRNRATKFAAGSASGVMSFVSSIGGPPVALLYSSDEAATIRPTLGAIFTIGISITIVARAVSGNISGTDVRVALVLFPAVIVGYLVSWVLKDYIPRHMVRTAILTVSAIAGAALIVRSLPF